MQSMMASEVRFGEGSAQVASRLMLIDAYTRAQALSDGALVDVSRRAAEAGFEVPVAVTRAVWERYVALTPAAERAGQDEQGRLWDILWMFRCAAARSRHTSEIRFSLEVVTHRLKPSPVRLKGVCGPGDSAEPVITIMLPDED